MKGGGGGGGEVIGVTGINITIHKYFVLFVCFFID